MKLNLSRVVLVSAGAAALMGGLSGCVVAPIGHPGVYVRPGIVVAAPPPPVVVVEPRPYYGPYYGPYSRGRRW